MGVYITSRGSAAACFVKFRWLVASVMISFAYDPTGFPILHHILLSFSSSTLHEQVPYWSIFNPPCSDSDHATKPRGEKIPSFLPSFLYRVQCTSLSPLILPPPPSQTNQSTSQSTNQPTNQPTSQPANQTNQPTVWPVPHTTPSGIEIRACIKTINMSG